MEVWKFINIKQFGHPRLQRLIHFFIFSIISMKGLIKLKNGGSIRDEIFNSVRIRFINFDCHVNAS